MPFLSNLRSSIKIFWFFFVKKNIKKNLLYNINTFPPLGGRRGGIKKRRVERPRPLLVT